MTRNGAFAAVSAGCVTPIHPDCSAGGISILIVEEDPVSESLSRAIVRIRTITGSLLNYVGVLPG